jgi:acetolactate synthase-1/3 small subunit
MQKARGEHMKRNVLSVLAKDQFGVMSKISSLFSRRGCNIHSLTVGAALEPQCSRIVVVVLGQEEKFCQIASQLSKVETVVQVEQVQEKQSWECMCAVLRLKPDAAYEISTIAGLQAQEQQVGGVRILQLSGPAALVESELQRLRPLSEAISCSGSAILSL